MVDRSTSDEAVYFTNGWNGFISLPFSLCLSPLYSFSTKATNTFLSFDLSLNPLAWRPNFTPEMANRRSGRSGSGDSFVVIMRGELQAKRLRVPPKFVKVLSRDLSQTATLITNSTASWHASVTRTDDKIYFKGGWENFFRDHSLGNFELLAFHYKGNMRFHVQIFDLDQCQRTQHATPQDQNPQSQNRTSPGGVELFTSSFPHFKICLKKGVFHPFYVLPIPMAATMVLNLPMETTNFIMRSGQRVWDVKCLFTAGRYKFSKGWRSFATDNKLKPGDTCLFELIASFELRVTIFRS